MKTTLPACFLCFALLALPAAAQAPNEKAARYLEPLLKRPGSGPLFERFVDAWLDSDTLENLEKYLTAKVQAEETTANRLLLAVYLSRQGETVKALEQFRAALAKDPGSADIWYQKAVVEARTLDFDSAVASLRKAGESKPAAALSLQVSQLLGRLLARSGRTDEALKVWQELMAARPDDEELREDVLELQIAEGLNAAAQATAEALVESAKDPYKKVLRRLRLGDVHDRAGARDKALETYAACLADSGADSWLEKEITAQIEKLFRREDDLAGLKAFYTKLLEKDARRLGLRRAQARLLVEMGESDAAVAAGRELLKLAPGDRAVREEFIALLAGAGKLPEAIAQLEELRKHTPNDAELLLRLATLQNDSGKKPEAAALVRGFVKLSGDEAARLRASGLLERCGLAEEAAAVLREGGESAALRQALASLLHKNGKKDAALTEWKKLARGSSTAALEAARALAAHGEPEAAWQLLKENAAAAENDTAFLTALCQTAERSDHAAEALPFVRKLVSRATLPADLEPALDLAMKLVRKADQTEALTKEVQAAAASAQDFALLASLREEARNSAGAEAALKQAEAASPELAAVLLVKLYTQRADFMQAALAMERLFTSPGGRKAHHAQSLTDLWVRAGQTEKALKAARDWRQLAPGSTTPVLTEARLLEAEGKDKESLEVLRRAAGQFEGNDDIRAQLAEAYRNTGRTADALRIYSSLYENAADLSAKMRWMQPWSQTAEEAGRTQDLVEQFEERRRASRDSVVPLLALAEIHRASGSYEGRRKALTEAARLKPNDPELALEIARLESREDNEDAAIRTLRAALPNDKTGAVRQDLVLLLLRTGEREEGLRLLAEGQADALKNPAAVESVTEGLMARDSEESALAFLAPHLSLHPDDYRLQLLAAMLEEEEQPDSAQARLLRVLGQRTELPDARLRAFTKTTARGMDEDELLVMMTQILPPQAVEFFKLSGAAQKLARQQRRGNQGRQAAIELPESLEEAQLAAAGLLVGSAQSYPEDQTAALLTGMERAGFASAALLRITGVGSLGSFYDEEMSTRLLELSAAHPEDETLLAMAVMSKLFDWQNPGSEEIAKRAWERFSKTRPALALLAALPAVGVAEEPAPWEEEAMKAAEAVTNPQELLLLSAVRVIGLPYGDEPREDVNEAVKKRMLALLQRWYGTTEFHGQNMGQLGGMIFMTLASGFGTAGDADGLAKLLDQEAVRSSGSQFVNYTGGSSRNNAVSQPLGFPPRALPLGLPPVILSVLSTNDDDGYSFLRTEKLDEEALRKAAEKVQHPLVKLLLLVRAADDEAAGKLIESRLTAPDPEAASYLLAAAWAEKQGEFVRAAEVAKRALFLPLSRESRKLLDMAFLSWADSDPASEPVLAAAREAALRMRRDVLTPQARQRLAAVMENLGLTSEAEKLAKQDANAAAGGATSGATIGGIAGRGSSQPVLTPSGKLLAAGKKNEALPLLTKEIQAFGREALKQSGWSGVRGFDEWLSTVQQFAMMTAVMKTVTSAESDAKALALHGAILDLAGDGKQATHILKKALAAGSTEAGVKVRLFRLIAAAEPKEAAQLLQQLPADARGEVFAMLAPGRSDPYGSSYRRSSYTSGGRRIYYSGSDESDGTKIATVNDAAEVLDAWISGAPAADMASAAWLSGALSTLAQPAAIDMSWSAPSLFTEKWESPVERSEENFSPGSSRKKVRPAGESEARETIRSRGEQFDRLLEKLADAPGVACLAWQAQRQRQHFDEKEPLPAKLFASGIASVLLDTGAQKAGPKTPADTQSCHGVFSRLLPTAVLTDKLTDLETKLLPELRRVTKGKALESLEQNWSLHRCAPEEFPAKVKEVVAKSRGTAWPQVMQAAGVRRTGVEITEDFLTWLEGKVKIGSDIREASAALTPAVRLVLDLKGRDAAEQWLHNGWERIGGPREERKKSLAALDGDGNFTGPWEQGITWMAWFTAQLWEDTTLLFTALRVYEEEYLGFVPEVSREELWDNNERGFNTAAAYVSGLVKGSRIQQLLDFLKESPFLGSAAEFHTCGGTDGLFVKIVDALSEADTPVLTQLGVTGSPEKLAFGQSLMAAGVAENRRMVLCNTMARWQKDITALPKSRREDLLVLLREWADLNNTAPEGLSSEGQAFRKWLDESGDEERMAGLDKEVTAFLDPKNLRTLRTSGSYDFESKIRGMLELLIKAESPRAWEVVEKVREHALQASRDPERNPLAEALVRMLDTNSAEVKPLCYSIALALHAAAAPGNASMPIHGRLMSELKDAGDDLGRMQRDPVARIKMIADGVAPFLKEGHAPLLLPVLSGALRSRAQQTAPPLDKACDAVITWTEGPGKKHERQDIVREIAAAARFMKNFGRKTDERKFTHVRTAENLPAWQQHYLAALSEGKQSPGLRLALAAFLADADAWQIEDLLLRQAVNLMEETVKSKTPVPLWQEVMVLEQFNLREDAPPVDLAARLLPIVQSGRAVARNNNNDDDLTRRGVKAVLRVALRSKDEAAAGRIVRACADMFDSQFLSIIVRDGTPEIMRAVLRPGRNGLFRERSTPGPNNESYDKELESKFDAVLTPVEHEDLRYMARLAVHALRPTGDSAEAPPAGPRLAALAADFAGITFKEVALRERALEILASEPESAAVVAGAIRESLEGLPISTIASLRDEEAKRRKKAMYFAALSGGATRGDFSMLESALSDVLPLVKGERDELSDLASHCLAAAGTAALRNRETQPETLAKACAAFRAVCSRPEFISKVEGWQRTAQFTALLHAMADKTADLDVWWKALPDEMRSRLSSGLQSTRLTAMTGGGGTRYYNNEPEEIPAYELPEFGKDKAAAAKLRDAVFLRFLASPLSGSGLGSLSDFVNAGWGTMEDALRLEAQWCAATKYPGLTALRFAVWHMERKELEATLTAADRGLKAAGPGRIGVPLDLLAMRQWALFQLNRSTEGLALFHQAAQMPAEKDEDEARAKANLKSWKQCAYWAGVGVAKQTGSMEETVKIAAMMFAEHKDDWEFWSRLEEAGVFAAEYLAKEKRIPESQAAAAFAVKARVKEETFGAKLEEQWKTRAAAALAGDIGQPVIPWDAEWRWLESSTGPGDQWLVSGFNDKSWKTGSGPFGFGDEGLKTEISNKSDDGTVLVSWPFRREFDVADPDTVKVLMLNLRVDDGAAVWVNGREAGRRNMPQGDIAHNSLAPLPVNQADEGRFNAMALDPKLLIKGRNTLAIAVHQQRPDSSDAAFHAELLLSSGGGETVPPDKAIQPLAPLLKDWPDELRMVFLP